MKNNNINMEQCFKKIAADDCAESFRTVYNHYYNRLFQQAMYYLNNNPDCAQEQAVLTLKMKDASLKEIIERMEQQTGYSFIYNEMVDLSFSKSVDIKEQRTEAALSAIFGKTGIEWKIRKKHIILTDRKAAAAQRVTVSGYITDADTVLLFKGAQHTRLWRGS